VVGGRQGAPKDLLRVCDAAFVRMCSGRAGWRAVLVGRGGRDGSGQAAGLQHTGTQEYGVRAVSRRVSALRCVRWWRLRGA